MLRSPRARYGLAMGAVPCSILIAALAAEVSPVVILGAVGCVALALAVMAKPQVAPILIAVAISLNGEGTPLQWEVAGLHVTGGNVLLYVVLLASVGGARRLGGQALAGSSAILALAYGALMLLSAVASPTGGFAEVLKWTLYWGLMFPVAFAILRSPARISTFLISWALISVIQSVVMIFQFGVLHDPRPMGTVGINVGFGIALGLVVAYGRALTGHSTARRWIWSLILLLCSVGLMLSLTRAAWLAAVAGLICISWLMGKAGRGRLLQMGAVTLAVFGLILVAPAGDGFRMRVASLPDDLALATSPTSNSIFARSGLVEVAVEMTAANPVLGVGPGQFPVNLHQYAVANDRLALLISEGQLFALGPHSQFLNSAAEIGVFGALLFAALILTTLRSSIAGARSNELATHEIASVLAGWLAAFLIESLLDDTNYGFHMYLLVVMIASVEALDMFRSAEPGHPKYGDMSRRRRSNQDRRPMSIVAGSV